MLGGLFLLKNTALRLSTFNACRWVLCLAVTFAAMGLTAEEKPVDEQPADEQGEMVQQDEINEDAPPKQAPKSDLEHLEVTIVVADEPYSGFLVPPASDTGFTFRLTDTGDKMTFRWSSLATTERKRVQRLFGIEVEDGLLKWGEEVKCVRFNLKSQKTVEGHEVPDRAIPGHRCLRTATQILHILRADILGEETIMKRESDVFSADEKYEELLLERPPSPDSSSDHLSYARTCSNMGLYERAIDHLEMAKVIDPRIEERTKDFRMELVRKHADKLAEQLYLSILFDLNGGDHFSALDKIHRLKRNFPNSEYYTRVDGMQAEVEKNAETDFQKKVIFMYYTTFNDLIDEKLAKRIRVDEKGRPVPSRPGKQITTADGRIFRGELVSDSEDEVVLKQGDVTLKITGKDVMSKQDVEMSKSFTSLTPSFTELKNYVANTDGGIGKDILDQISLKLRADPNRVRDAWESRFVSSATYKDGVYTKSKTWATLHKAFYGKGSWLREGITQAQAPRSGGTRNSTGSNAEAGPVNPETSDDPDIWWKDQKLATKKNLLRALGAEKLFQVKNVSGKSCDECGGTGFLKVFDSLGSMSFIRCPKCRGLRMLFQVYYE